MLEGEFHL